MSPLATVWGAAAALRVACYRRGLLRVHTLGRPTISVGALEMGGTGKTPTTAALARALRDAGRRVAILSRGYARRSRGAVLIGVGEGPLVGPHEAGDEPYGYARQLEGVAVAVASRREAAAACVPEAFGVDLYLLDDAFQHVRVARDLDLLVVDSEAPFWLASPPPTGRLREAVSAASRADAFVVTGPRFEECRRELGRRFPGRPVFGMRREYPGAIPLGSWRAGDVQAADPPGRVVAFAGIARPARFFDSLSAAGIEVVERRPFADHHWYARGEIAELSARAASQGAALITTEKDAVRLLDVAELPAEPYVWPQRLLPHSTEELLGWIDRRLSGRRT